MYEHVEDTRNHIYKCYIEGINSLLYIIQMNIELDP